jgi:hypothetical protein
MLTSAEHGRHFSPYIYPAPLSGRMSRIFSLIWRLLIGALTLRRCGLARRWLQQRRHPAMLSATLSRRNETSAGRPLFRPGAAHGAWRRKILRLYVRFRLRIPRSHGIARRNRRRRSAGVRLDVRRLAVRTRLGRPVQCEDRQSRAEQQPGGGFEIIPAAHLRFALVAEIARAQAETRLQRVPAFGAKVGLVEDDFHRNTAPIRAFARSIAQSGLLTPDRLIIGAALNQ